MAQTDLNMLFRSLYRATTSTEVATVLQSIGDRSDSAPGKPILESGLVWRAFGDTLSNQSSIGLATKPGRSITERVTNAFDAILEKRAAANVGPMPLSPSGAAERWFGRPISGPDSGLFSWKYAAGQNDKLVSMVLLPSDKDGHATIDVLDRGCGIVNKNMSSTILSLQQGNKITKRYLAGAYGQGGASTLSFCDYALIISRAVEESSKVSFTLIRILSLSEEYKVDAYAYLALDDETRNVPFVDIPEDLDLYPFAENRDEIDRALGTQFSTGTIVRHYSYRLTGLDGKLGPAPGNLYHFLQLSLFDPLLPVRIIDLRTPEKPRREVILGSRNRLMKRNSASQSEGDDDTIQEGNIQVRHHRSMEYFAPHGGDEPTIGIEYWVVFAFRKGKGGQGTELRGYSNDLFVNRLHPIIGTVNGQNHGELSGQLIREAGLPLLSRHIIVHIDASSTGTRVIRELFSTNREGFKDGPVLSGLQRGLQAMLREDERLSALERELVESIAAQSAQTASDDVKLQVVTLLLEAGFKPQELGPAPTPGSGEPAVVKPISPKPPIVPDPLNTLPFPQVTEWKIAYPSGDFDLPLSELKTILVETNADQQFDAKGLISIRCEPPIVDVVSKTKLKTGRIRWRIKTNETAQLSNGFLLTCTITRPDGTQLLSNTNGRIVPAPIQNAKPSRAQVPQFDIIGIHPKDDANTWNTVWPEIDADCVEENVLRNVAYKVLKTDKLVVYYSKMFGPFEKAMSKLTLENSPLLAYFRTNYEVWIGYHAILQHSDKQIEPGEEVGSQFEEERCRVAIMQVKQALRSSDVLNKLQMAQAQEVSNHV